MDIKKRKEYFIITTIVYGVGFFLFGIAAVVDKELLNIQINTFLVLLIYGFGGGILTGGMASGIILFSQFVKKKRLSFKIVISVFFPLTFMLICEIGILSFIPCTIHNFMMIKKLKNNK